MSGELSRRAVLGGAVAGVAGALLTRIPTLAAAPPTGSMGQARVGGTLNLEAFQQGTTWSQAVEIWNQKTRTKMRCWKIYYEPGQFGTMHDDIVKTMVAMNIQALISIKPAISQSTTDRDAMVALLQRFKLWKLKAEVCLWQEVGSHVMSPSQYHSYVQFYGPSIRQIGYPLVFDAPGSKGPEEWKAYDPGRSNLDGYAVDYYCTTFLKPFRLDTLTDLAGPLPIGIWEMGGAGPGSLTPNKNQIHAYMTYLQNFLTQRQASGLPVGSVAWFNGPHKGSNRNEVVGTHLNPEAATDITDYQALYKAVNQVS